MPEPKNSNESLGAGEDAYVDADKQSLKVLEEIVGTGDEFGSAGEDCGGV